MNKRAIQILILLAFTMIVSSFASAEPQNGLPGQGVGSIDNECQAGFGPNWFGIAKWEWDEEDEEYFLAEGEVEPYDTNVEGDQDEANWTSDPEADGIISKEGPGSFTHPGGSEGTVNKDGENGISHITFCGQEQFCEYEEFVIGEEDPEEYDPIICNGESNECSEYGNEFACEKLIGCEWDEDACVDDEGAAECSEYEKYSACLNAGCEASCEEEQEESGKLTIVKEATPEDGTDFEFYIGNGQQFHENFLLDDANPDDTDGVNQSKMFELAPGTYNITEEVPDGWELVDIQCEGVQEGDGIVNENYYELELGANDNVTCTFYNEKENEEEEPVCGDGEVNQESEVCDDGNTESGDGCSIVCQVEEEFVCEEGQKEVLVQAAIYPADSVNDSEQGTQKDGDAVRAQRSVPEQGLEFENGQVESHFFTLGFGGWIIVEFDNPALNRPGPDVRVTEDTWGGPYPDETADVFASKDGSTWVFLGTADNSDPGNTHTHTNLDLGELSWARFIKIVDTSDPDDFNGSGSQGPDADGFDLNAVRALQDNVECVDLVDTTCVQAKEQGLIFGELENGHGIAYNNDTEWHQVSLAIYQMYSGNVADQTLFSSETVWLAPGENYTFWLETPGCAYQKDLICGEPLPDNPEYGNLVIESEFNGLGEWCQPEPRDNQFQVEVSIAPNYPQGGDFVFVCDVQGFTPISYWWYFGDGDQQPNSSNMNVFHRYEFDGNYTVACSATDGENWQTGVLGVEVEGSLQCSEEDTRHDLAEIPASCNGGLVISDEMNGCREIECSDGENFLSVQACPKPDEGPKTRFEMYKQGETPESGSGLEVCLGGTCISDNGFAESPEFPLCAPEVKPEDLFFAILEVEPFFPQGCDVSFACNAYGGSGDYSYDWNYDDGSLFYDIENSKTFHTYPEMGVYDPTCGVWDQQRQEQVYSTEWLKIDETCEPQIPEEDGNETPSNNTPPFNESGEENDDDQDGFSESEGDCNDANPFVNPGMTEVCNEIDDNCNGEIDEGDVCTEENNEENGPSGGPQTQSITSSLAFSTNGHPGGPGGGGVGGFNRQFLSFTGTGFGGSGGGGCNATAYIAEITMPNGIAKQVVKMTCMPWNNTGNQTWP